MVIKEAAAVAANRSRRRIHFKDNCFSRPKAADGRRRCKGVRAEEMTLLVIPYLGLWVWGTVSTLFDTS